MLLIQIKEYILRRQEVTLLELAAHFNMPESAIEKMTDHWVQKGIIQKLNLVCSNSQDTSQCNGCTSGCAIQERIKPIATTITLYRPF